MNQPDDPGVPGSQDWDPSGYYEQKAKKADAMILHLTWFVVIGLVIVSSVLAWHTFTN